MKNLYKVVFVSVLFLLFGIPGTGDAQVPNVEKTSCTMYAPQRVHVGQQFDITWTTTANTKQFVYRGDGNNDFVSPVITPEPAPIEVLGDVEKGCLNTEGTSEAKKCKLTVSLNSPGTYEGVFEAITTSAGINGFCNVFVSTIEEPQTVTSADYLQITGPSQVKVGEPFTITYKKRGDIFYSKLFSWNGWQGAKITGTAYQQTPSSNAAPQAIQFFNNKQLPWLASNRITEIPCADGATGCTAFKNVVISEPGTASIILSLYGDTQGLYGHVKYSVTAVGDSTGTPSGSTLSCKINGQTSSTLTKNVNEPFTLPWTSVGADWLRSSGWTGPIQCNDGSDPRNCKDVYMGGGMIGPSASWGNIFMESAGTASVTLTPLKNGVAGPSCSITVKTAGTGTQSTGQQGGVTTNTPGSGIGACGPKEQTVEVGQEASFDFSGGSPLQWTAPFGNPIQGFGPTFKTRFSKTGQQLVYAYMLDPANPYSACKVNVIASTVSQTNSGDTPFGPAINTSTAVQPTRVGENPACPDGYLENRFSNTSFARGVTHLLLPPGTTKRYCAEFQPPVAPATGDPLGALRFVIYDESDQNVHPMGLKVQNPQGIVRGDNTVAGSGQEIFYSYIRAANIKRPEQTPRGTYIVTVTGHSNNVNAASEAKYYVGWDWQDFSSGVVNTAQGGDTTLRPGDKVEIDSGDQNRVNVRSTPNGTIIGTYSNGVQGCVVEGPQTAGPYQWMKVDFDLQADGWTTARFLKKIGTCEVQPGDDFKVGDTIKVNVPPDSLLTVRDNPAGLKIGSQPRSAKGSIVGGPTVGGLHTWWRIDFKDGVDGWVSGSFIIQGQRDAEIPTGLENLTVGMRVRVETESPQVRLNVRSSPGGGIIAKATRRSVGMIKQGPETQGEYKWWFVDFDNREVQNDGWVIGNYLVQASSTPEGN